jgi:hypothetical protein
MADTTKEEEKSIADFNAIDVSGSYGTQFKAVVDALSLSTIAQIHLKGSIDDLVEDSKVLIKLTRALKWLTVVLIVVGLLTILLPLMTHN